MENSVQMILQEVNSLVAVANECTLNHYDISIDGMVTNLTNQCIRLQIEFNNQARNRDLIVNIKEQVNAIAIQLERQLYVKYNKYQERVKLREYAEILYVDIRKLFTKEMSKDDISHLQEINTQHSNNIAEYGELLKWSINFLFRSKCIRFNETEEDVKMLRRLTEIIKEYKQNVKL